MLLVLVVTGLCVAGLAGGIALVAWGGGDREDPMIPSYAHTVGEPTAPLTIVEWADFQCPFCRFFATDIEPQMVQELVADGRVRFVFRHMAFLGDESRRAAQASECAGDQGRFWDYHDKLFANWDGENRGAFADSNLRRFAGEIGLDQGQFDACFNSGKYVKRIEDDRQAARDLSVNSTPTFFYNGDKVEGAPRSYALFRQVVERFIAEGAIPQ
jgi:protein-disulfide isomerase